MLDVGMLFFCGSKEEEELIHLHSRGNISCFHQYSLFARVRASAVSAKSWRGSRILLQFSAFLWGVFYRCQFPVHFSFSFSLHFYLRVASKHLPLYGEAHKMELMSCKE